jgi:hypothetical protein
MRQPSRGTCALCHGEHSKPAMARHLQTCLQQAGSEPQTGKQQPPRPTRVFHLVVEGRYLPMYWLHLEVIPGTTLATLDRFLRAIWLECCGHLSAFTIAGVRYVVDEGLIDGDWGWGPPRKNMQVRLEDVLSPGQSGEYEYDFGSTTALRIKMIAEREGARPEKAIQILARNSLPFIPCDLCGKPATMICTRCTYKGAGDLCEDCAKDHDCCEEMILLPVANSPRAGVCGYTGQHAPSY